MNNKIKAAVAGAILASASVANAGITWDAGEWTVDMSGNVNSFAIITDATDSAVATGGLAQAKGNDSTSTFINTGLLPNFLGFTASTRQNDLDTSITISFNPGGSSKTAASGGSGEENRQAFLTFGDQSWGSFKFGKDLGIFGSTAILNDMTLLGVGAPASTEGGGNTTLGRIGTGFMYADWQGQIAYTTPNMNGLSLTVGIAQPWDAISSANAAKVAVSDTSSGSNDEFSYQAQGSYSWTGDFAGKIWVGAYHQEISGLASGGSDDAQAFEAGVSTSIYNINLVAYAYSGEGIGTTFLLSDGFDTTGKKRDSDGGYVQATYVIPTGTKLGVSYGLSSLDDNAADAGKGLVEENNMLTVGAYHPLTKHLNLVAEYSHIETEAHDTISTAENDVLSIGAILFF
jgi:predicted porin